MIVGAISMIVGAVSMIVGAISRSRFPHQLTLTLAAILLTTTTTTTAAEVRTTADGVYSSEQAKSGFDVHQKYCAKCHHQSYYQGAFLQSWQNQPVASLYDLIKLKMPEDRPGALRPREYAALLAFVFELNQLPAGEARLGHEHAEMQSILITAP